MWADGGVLLLATPFLMFPTLTDAGVVAALLLVLLSWLAGWRRTPPSAMNLALAPFLLMVGVGASVSADVALTMPKVTNIILGVTLWRFVRLYPTSLVAWPGYLAAAGGMAMLGGLATDWPSKLQFLPGVLETLEANQVRIPESPARGIQANQLAAVLLLLLPVTLCLSLDRGRSRTGRLAMGLISLVALTVLLLTQSRGAWLGLAAGLLFIAAARAGVGTWASDRRLLLSVAGVVLMGVMIAWALPAIYPSLEAPPQETVVGNLRSLRFRGELWRWGVAAVHDFPLTGVGLGAFRDVARRLYPVNIVAANDLAHAHNVLLQVALDGGLPGLIAYLGMLLATVQAAWPRSGNSRANESRQLGLLACLVALHAFGLADTLSLGAKPGLLLWWCLGLLLPSWHHGSRMVASPGAI
jgi:putative inorganic carbon (HCO3(-)) transporter